MDDCLFCKIIAGEIPSERLYEDERVIVFRDIHPAAPVHVLIVPRRHYDDTCELAGDQVNGPQDSWAIMQAAAKVAASLGVDQQGFRLINNCGQDGGQTIRHVHVHLLAGKSLGEKLL